jgi:biopolymer transport protein ExbD
MSGHGKKRKPAEADTVNLGFQIAPMIDVVFVIMLFFMVMAGAVKKEKELKLQLPGVASASSDPSLIPPDEITVAVEESGHVTLNEEEMDTPDNHALPNFTANMTRLKKEADQRQGKVLVTIQAQEQAKYERVIDVINAMAKAGVSNLTFSVGGEE